MEKNAPFIKELQQKIAACSDPEIAKRASDDLPLVFFVRREQLPQYKHLKDRFRVVPIDGVKDIGETRSKILKWARVKGYDNIFMLDDDVTQVDYLYPWETSGGKLCMRASHINEHNGENGLRPLAFRMWQAPRSPSCGSMKGRCPCFILTHTASPRRTNCTPSVSTIIWPAGV